jgi:hypothetical protein
MKEMKLTKLLLRHERKLLASGELKNITHTRSSAIWLDAPSTLTSGSDAKFTTVYRVMGDIELQYLLANSQLPNTQPYQAITRGQDGREYMEKYLAGLKWVDSCPTTIVEFLAPTKFIEQLFAKFSKNEDGARSHGLGDKAGKHWIFSTRAYHNWKPLFVSSRSRERQL